MGDDLKQEKCAGKGLHAALGERYTHLRDIVMIRVLPTINLASQMAGMSRLAAFHATVFHRVRLPVRRNIRPPLPRVVHELRYSPSPGSFALARRDIKRPTEDARPSLDRQVVRFIDLNQPLTSEAFVNAGFSNPTKAILMADGAYDDGVLLFDPAKTFIASALMFVDSISASISHIALKYGSRGLEHYHYTYHPMEEMRIQAEIDGLRVADEALGHRRIPHISRGALIRIIEQIAKAYGLPHPRLLTGDDFKLKLAGWNTQVQGLYKFFWKLLSQEQGAGRIVDFMLDRLGVERLEELPPPVQARFLGAGPSRINWKFVGPEVKAYLLSRLAEEAGVVHPRFLTSDHFRELKIEELGSKLIGLYDIYVKRVKEPGKAVKAMLDDAGIEPFESLPWDVQLEGFRQRDNIKWALVPATTQLKLLEMAKDLMSVKNGLKCPHLRALITDELKVLIIKEIKVGLGGLHDYYRRRMPEDYEGTVLDFMLDQLGVEKFENLPYELQCSCLRYDQNRQWDRVPAPLILKFMERLREILGLPHVRFISGQQMQRTVIPEIGQSLGGLYTHFRLKRMADDKREIVDIILDYAGAPRFDEMPFALQLQWTQRPVGKLTSWRRVSDAVILHYLRELMRGARARTSDDLVAGDFTLRVGGRERGLIGLYNYLSGTRAELGVPERTIDWAFSHYGVDVQFAIEAKRMSGGRTMLDPREKLFLIEMAKMGDRTAMDHLVYFYEPLLRSIVHSVLSMMPRSQFTAGELLQLGRIEFAHLVELYDPAIASLETYVKVSLSLRLKNAIRRDSGDVHVPASYLGFMLRVGKISSELAAKLGRWPTEVELAEELGVKVDKLMSMRALRSTQISLFSPPAGGDDERTYEDVIADERAVRPDIGHPVADMRELIERAINGSGLGEREKFILRQSSFEGHGLEEIGRMVDLCGERVRQVIVIAMRKIAEGPYAEILKELL